MSYEILFMGTPEFSVPILKSLNSEHKILSVYTQPPKKKARGQKILETEGLLATCIQHEMDHLEGILFIDYLSKLKKNMIIKKLSKHKKSLERVIV